MAATKNGEAEKQQAHQKSSSMAERISGFPDFDFSLDFYISQKNSKMILGIFCPRRQIDSIQMFNDGPIAFYIYSPQVGPNLFVFPAGNIYHSALLLFLIGGMFDQILQFQ